MWLHILYMCSSCGSVDMTHVNHIQSDNNENHQLNRELTNPTNYDELTAEKLK